MCVFGTGLDCVSGTAPEISSAEPQIWSILGAVKLVFPPEVVQELHLHRCIARSGKLDRARSRLYLGQILQENMRLKALAEIYTMHSFWNPLHSSAISIF